MALLVGDLVVLRDDIARCGVGEDIGDATQRRKLLHLPGGPSFFACLRPFRKAADRETELEYLTRV